MNRHFRIALIFILLVASLAFTFGSQAAPAAPSIDQDGTLLPLPGGNGGSALTGDTASLTTNTTTGSDAPIDLNVGPRAYNCNLISLGLSVLQCQTLVDIYNNTNGDSWTTKTNWLVTNNYCNWYGVNCVATLIVSIQLPNNNLVGTLPNNLNTFLSLTNLNLKNNKLSGSIPTSLTSLTGLLGLDLSGNAFSGSIPATLSSLVSLILNTLHLDYNQLTASDAGLLSFLNLINPTWDDTQTIAPTNPGTSGATINSINVTWSPILYTGDSGYYEIMVSTTSNGSFTSAGVTANKSATQFTVTSLQPNTTYYFKVRAVTNTHANNPNNTLTSAFTAEVSASTLTNVVNVPTNFNAAAVSTSQINLSWTALAAGTEMRIERSDNNGTSWTQIASLANTATSFSNTDLNCGTAYQYRARAYNTTTLLYSNYTTVVSATTNTCLVPTPEAPLSLNLGTILPTSVQLVLPNILPGLEARVERSDNNGASWTQIAVLATGTVSYTDENLLCATNYQYRVRFYNPILNVYSLYSPTTSVTTGICPVVTPEAPLSLNLGAILPDSVQLLLPNILPGLEARVERSDDNGATWTQVAVVASGNISYTDENLECATAYQYRIRFYNPVLNVYSLYSPVSSVTTSACPVNAPDAPTSFQIDEVNDYSISFTWTNSSATTQTRIERSIDPLGLIWAEVANVEAGVTSHLDDDLSCNTAYQYRARAYDATTQTYSVYTSIVSATTKICPVNTPEAPLGLELGIVLPDSVQLLLPTILPGLEARVERSDDGGATWTQIGVVNSEGVSFTDENVTCATVYQYRIRFYNPILNTFSLYSPVSEVTTPACPVSTPEAPTSVSADATSQTSAEVSWNNNSVSLITEVERSDDDGETWTQVAVLLAGINSYNDNGLTCNTTYSYRVRSYDAISMTYSPYVVTNSILTDACDNGTATEVPPTATATEVPGTATEVPPTETEVPGTPTDEPTQTATIDPTDEVTPTPTDDGVVTPEAPVNLATNGISEAGIGLSWTNGDATLETHLERSIDSGVTWTEITVVVPGGFTYTDTNVTCDTAYQYRARSYNSTTATFSDYSNTLSVTSNACGLDILINGKIEADDDNNRLPDGWTGKRLTKDKMVTNKVNRPGKPDKIVVYEGVKAFVFKSPAAQNKKLIQKQTNLTGLAGDTLTMNIYAKAKNLPETARARAKLKIGYADGSFDKVIVTITNGSYDYTHFTHMPFVTPKDYTNVKVTLQFKAPSGKLYLDGMSLMLDFPTN